MAAIREQWWIPQLSEAPESYSNFPIAEVSYGGEQTVARKTRPQLIVSDNAMVFKTTANWIRKIRKNEQLQNYLATREIR